jgi:D-arginine dehydrogenase
MPFTGDLAGRWYVKADGDAVLCSPEGASLHVPGDPRPDELEIARAMEAITDVTTLRLRSVRTSWAGLRAFAPNGESVAAWDDRVAGQFWLVGPGGYGIQTAPAPAVHSAELVRRGPAASRVGPRRDAARST